MALALIVAWTVTVLFRSPISTMFARERGVKNYLGKTIPTGMGLVMLIAVLGGMGVLVCGGHMASVSFKEQGFWLTLVCLAGLTDDAYGSKEDRGFRGHFLALLRGQLTTGMVKVLVIGFGSILAFLPYTKTTLLQGGVLLFSVNLFNQLDLRPGRALKTFLLFMVGPVLAGNAAAVVGCGAALGLLPGDLSCRYMLGDAGANLLGALAGLAVVTWVTGPWLIVVLVLLVLGNGVGELFSFSRIIESNKILRWFDQIGRS